MSPVLQFRKIFTRRRGRLAGMAALAVSTLVGASTAVLPTAHAAVSADFMQCSNDNPPDDLGDCLWINGIIQPNNSQYQEGMSVPQRILLTDIPATPGDVHTLIFSVDATKGGIHAYDWLTSWDQALASDPDGLLDDLDTCGEMISNTFETICQDLVTGGVSTTADVPDDPFVSANGGAYQTRINEYETDFGDRTIEIFGNEGFVGTATLSLAHDPAADLSDDGDSKIVYTLTWTSASTDIMVLLAGHLAVGDNGLDAWGPGLGASSINGGPYHFMLSTLDGISLGSQDNQIMASAVVPRGEPEVGRIFVEKQTDPPGATQVFQFDADYGDFSLVDGGVNNSGPLAPGTYSVDEIVPSGWTLESVTCVNQDGVAQDPAAIVLTAGETVTCTFVDVREPDDDYDQYPGDSDFDFDTPFDDSSDPVIPSPETTVAGTVADPAPQTQSDDLLTVAGATDLQPAPAGDAAPTALAELPRTGAGVRHLVVAGLMLIIGGLALLARPRRRNLHQA